MALLVLSKLFHALKSLELLKTLRRLQYCPHPYLTLWRLIWPIPWKYRLPPPQCPLYIRDDPDVVHRIYYVEENFRILRFLPLFRLRDTPLRSLYRLHDALCSANDNYIMLEGDYFWHRSDWRVRDIPDPRDADPIRYAILASLVEEMARSFNEKITLGLRRGFRRIPVHQILANCDQVNKPLEEIPPWALAVPSLEEWVSFEEDGGINELRKNTFSKRRISASAHQLGNI